MDERELNRTIDAAAEQMMAREPSRSLNYAVMARVREGAAPPRRLIWAMGAASLLLCAAIVIALMYRAPHAIPSLPESHPLAIAQTPRSAAPPVITANDTRPAYRIRPQRVARDIAVPAPPVKDVLSISPIETEPIEVGLIDVPQLPQEVTSIEHITIEPLTIEPLMASND